MCVATRPYDERSLAVLGSTGDVWLFDTTHPDDWDDTAAHNVRLLSTIPSLPADATCLAVSTPRSDEATGFVFEGYTELLALGTAQGTLAVLRLGSLALERLFKVSARPLVLIEWVLDTHVVVATHERIRSGQHTNRLCVIDVRSGDVRPFRQ